MDLRESIKDDLKQEFKYILHSQRQRNAVAIVGNFKNIDYKFTHPLFHYGTVLNDALFNIMLCLLSDGIMLPPLIFTSVADTVATIESSLVTMNHINFTATAFEYWLRSVWKKRNKQNIQSLLVTSTHLPNGADKILKKYKTDLVILPDIIKADIEPLNEVWSNEFINEIVEKHKACSEEFSGIVTLKKFYKIIYAAWEKCSKAANFDRLFVVDEDQAIASILENEFVLQKQWIRKPYSTSQDRKLNLDFFEVFRCISCYNLFHIEECGRHSLTEVTTLGDSVFPYRRLLAIGHEMHFTCFAKHDGGAFLCELCGKELWTSYLAAHHILKHLQQKWCRICFKQLFICQKHICFQMESEPSVFAKEEGILTSALACEHQHMEPNNYSYEEVPADDLPSSSAEYVFTQHNDVFVENVSSVLEGLLLIETRSFENTDNFSLNTHNTCNSDVRPFPTQNSHEFLGTENHSSSEIEGESTSTLTSKGLSSPQIENKQDSLESEDQSDHTLTSKDLCSLQMSENKHDRSVAEDESDHMLTSKDLCSPQMSENKHDRSVAEDESDHTLTSKDLCSPQMSENKHDRSVAEDESDHTLTSKDLCSPQMSENKHNTSDVDDEGDHTLTSKDLCSPQMSENKHDRSVAEDESDHTLTSKDLCSPQMSENKHNTSDVDDEGDHTLTSKDLCSPQMSENKHDSSDVDYEGDHTLTSKDLCSPQMSENKHNTSDVDDEGDHTLTSKDLCSPQMSENKHDSSDVDYEGDHTLTSKDLCSPQMSENKHNTSDVDDEGDHTLTSKDLCSPQMSENKHDSSDVDYEGDHTLTSKDLCSPQMSENKHNTSDVESESDHTLTSKDLCSPQMPEKNDVDENSQSDDDSTFSICSTQEKHDVENLASKVKKARLRSLEYFRMLDYLAENEDYFLEEIEPDKSDSIPDLFHVPSTSDEQTAAHVPTTSGEQAAAVTKQRFLQDHGDDRIVVSEDNRFYQLLRTPGSLSFRHTIPDEVPSAGMSIQEESVLSKEESVGNKDNMQSSQTLKEMNYDSNVESICNLCDKELITSADVLAHVCNNFYYPMDVKELLGFSTNKTPPKSIINQTGTLCNYCGTKLFNDSEVVHHVCPQKLEVCKGHYELLENLEQSVM